MWDPMKTRSASNQYFHKAVCLPLRNTKGQVERGIRVSDGLMAGWPGNSLRGFSSQFTWLIEIVGQIRIGICQIFFDNCADFLNRFVLIS